LSSESGTRNRACVALIALPSSEAERFDRAKPRGFLRLGGHKRRGFRALGFKKQ
jgi:hypothetical protein